MLDALVAHAGGPTTVDSPITATVAGTMRVSLVQTGPTWTLVAPDTATLAAMRPAMGLPPEAPVPVEVMMTFSHGDNHVLAPLEVEKTVWIGEPRDNPPMPAIQVSDAPAGDQIVVPADRDVYLSTTVPDGWHVNWLTSAGTLYQDDQPTSFIHIGAKDPQSGELACVIRDDQGGVVWKVWPLRTQ